MTHPKNTLARYSNVRLPNPERIFIYTEGKETEPNYFRAMRDDDTITKKYTITIKDGKGQSPLKVVEGAIGYLKNLGKSTFYDQKWCVLDVEDSSKSDVLLKACKLASDNDFKLCLSNPSFEVWYLSHFEKSPRFLFDGRAAKSEVKRLWQKHFNRDYDENDARQYADLRSSLRTAVENAQWVLENHHWNGSCKDCNSSTEVYKLILRLCPDVLKDAASSTQEVK